MSLPIRVRVTAAFAGVMAVLLLGLGLFVYLRFASQLLTTVDQGLRTRSEDLGSRVSPAGAGLDVQGALAKSDESFAEVLAADGSVIDASPQLQGAAVVDPGAVRIAGADGALRDLAVVPNVEGRVRVLITKVNSGGESLVLVVGSSLDDRAEALHNLAALLLFGGLIALALASAAGYGMTAGALRPVELMRRRAESISVASPGERLPSTGARDELGRLGETLNAMLARIDETIERERQFVDDASHELRTPLALQKTELELALLYAKDEEELRQAIASAVEEVDRLTALAADLLVVARSEKGELSVEPVEVPAADLLAEAISRARRVDGRSDERLSVGPIGVPVVFADRLRIERALANLIHNAIAHGDGPVVISARKSGDGVDLVVSDTGPGFPPEFLGNAFERFSRADAGRTSGGSGLGLAIVASIAAAHGGEAGARNRAGGGAEAWIHLPARAG